MSKEVVQDSIKYLPAKVVPAFVGIVSIPILTHLLPQEQYGQYLLVLTSLSLIASFFFSWLVAVTLRFYVVYGVESLIRTCRTWLIASVLFGCLFWIAVARLLDGIFATWYTILVGCLWLVAYGSFEYFAGWLRARNFAMAYSAALSWRSISGLLTAVALLLLDFHGGAVVIFAAACAMLIALVFMPHYALQPECKQYKKVDSSDSLSSVLKYGIPAAFSTLIITGLSLADRYVIGAQMGVEFVAIYGACYDIAEKTIFFANSMLLLSSSVIGFRIFEQEGEAKAAAFLSRLMRFYLLAAPPLVVGLALLSPHIIAILLPTKYAEGAIVLPIVALGGLFVGIMHRYTLLLSFHKRMDVIMWCSAGALLVNLVSCLMLIPSFGLIGSAVSTLFAYTSWLLFILLATMKYQRPIFPWKTLFRVCGALAVSAGAMAAIIYHSPAVGLFRILTSFVFGMITYAMALYLLKEVTSKDVLAITQALGNRFRRVK